MDTPKIGLSVYEATELSGLGRTTIFKLIKSGCLKAHKAGRRTIIRPEDLTDCVRSLPVREVAGQPHREAA
jgi:excisionase family DNA binding protein